MNLVVIPILIVVGIWIYSENSFVVSGLQNQSNDMLPKNPIDLTTQYHRSRRSSSDAHHTVINKMKMIARITNGIYLQQGLITGTIPSDVLIPELLRFASVTPSQVAAMDISKIEEAVETLKTLPSKIGSPNTQVIEVEKVFEGLDEIWKAIDGIGDIRKWIDGKEDFKKEIVELTANGVKSAIIKNTSSTGASTWESAFGDLSNDATKFDDFLFKAYFNFLKNIFVHFRLFNIVFQNIDPVWKFKKFKSVSEGFSPINKASEGVKIYISNHGKTSLTKTQENAYLDYLHSFVDHVKPVKDVESSIRNSESLITSRGINYQNQIFTYGFLDSPYDFSNTIDDFDHSWISKLRKTDHLITAFNRMRQIERSLFKVERSIGSVDDEANSLFESVENIMIIVREEEKIKNLMAGDGKCKKVNPIVIDATDFSIIQTNVASIDKKLATLQRLFDQMAQVVKTPGILEMCDELIPICEEAKTSSNVQEVVQKFKNYSKLAQLNDHFMKFLKIEKEISDVQKPTTIQQHAKKVVEKFEAIDKYQTALNHYADYFECLQESKSVFNAAAIIRNIRNIKGDQDYRDSLDKGMNVVRKVIGTSFDLENLENSIKEMKGLKSPETDALTELKRAAHHSKTLGLAVQGVSNMKNVLDQKPDVMVIAKNQKDIQEVLDDTNVDLSIEEIHHLKDVIELGGQLEKMFTSLEHFEKSTSDPNSNYLINYAHFFKEAKKVVGIKRDIAEMSAQFNKITEKVKKDALLEVKLALDTLSKLDLDFSKYSSAFDDSMGSLAALDTFFASYAKKFEIKEPTSQPMYQEQKCESCPEIPPEPFLDFEPIVITCACGATATFILFCMIFYSKLTEPDDSENFDTVPMDSPIALEYYRTTCKKVKAYKESMNMTDTTSAQEFHAYFTASFAYDSAASTRNVPNFVVEEHAKDQRENIPLALCTRVKLTEYGDRFDNDFLHGSSVVCPSDLELILSQGPQAASEGKNSTIGKYWWAIMQKKSEFVIMLCQLVENGKVQCARYFPDDAGQELFIDGAHIKCLSKTMAHKGLIEIRKLAIKFEGEKKFYVTHFLFNGWPEYGVPTSLEAVRSLLVEVKTSWYPVFVHCSDGIGRSGCLAYIELAYQRLSRDEGIDFGQILDLLRSKRAGAVSNAKQYGFCAFAIAYYAFKETVIYFTNILYQKEYEYLEAGYEGWDDVEKMMKKDGKVEKVEKKKIEKSKESVTKSTEQPPRKMHKLKKIKTTKPLPVALPSKSESNETTKSTENQKNEYREMLDETKIRKRGKTTTKHAQPNAPENKAKALPSESKSNETTKSTDNQKNEYREMLDERKRRRRGKTTNPPKPTAPEEKAKALPSKSKLDEIIKSMGNHKNEYREMMDERKRTRPQGQKRKPHKPRPQAKK